jgi:transglutaminase-like putative cysteine protease
LSITSRIVVEQFVLDVPAFAVASSAQSYPFAYSPDDYADLGALLTPQYADAVGGLKTWADGFVRAGRTDTLSLLNDLNTKISAYVFYQSREEGPAQGPLETLARGWGTCRDFAVLLAEAARVLGFGARIVSGYLYNPNTVLTGSQDAGSTHAWAEVYVPGVGWIAFDPTNRAMGGANLIRIAVARNIEQTSPASGSFTGVPDDFIGMDVAVSVTRVPDAATHGG